MYKFSSASKLFNVLYFQVLNGIEKDSVRENIEASLRSEYEAAVQMFKSDIRVKPHSSSQKIKLVRRSCVVLSAWINVTELLGDCS